MADVKISDMVAGSALTGAEQFEMVQSAGTFKTAASAIATYVRSLLSSATDGLSYVQRNGANKAYSIFQGYVANQWYAPDQFLTPTAGSATTANTIYFSPLRIFEKVTISTLAIMTTATGTNCSLAIYPMDPTSKRPLINATPLAQTASFSIATATTYSIALTSAVTLDPGLYWLGHNTDAAATIVVQTSSQSWTLNYTGASAASSVISPTNVGKYGFTLAQTFGAWPTTGTPTEVPGTGSHALYASYLVSAVF